MRRARTRAAVIGARDQGDISDAEAWLRVYEGALRDRRTIGEALAHADAAATALSRRFPMKPSAEEIGRRHAAKETLEKHLAEMRANKPGGGS